MKNTAIKLLDTFNLVSFANNLINKYKYLTDYNLRHYNSLVYEKGLPDGLPIPPPQLIFLVSGHYDLEEFYHNSNLGYDSIKSILEKNNLDINKFRNRLHPGNELTQKYQLTRMVASVVKNVLDYIIINWNDQQKKK